MPLTSVESGQLGADDHRQGKPKPNPDGGVCDRLGTRIGIGQGAAASVVDEGLGGRSGAAATRPEYRQGRGADDSVNPRSSLSRWFGQRSFRRGGDPGLHCGYASSVECPGGIGLYDGFLGRSRTRCDAHTGPIGGASVSRQIDVAEHTQPHRPDHHDEQQGQ